MTILPACIYVNCVLAWYLRRSEEGIGTSGMELQLLVGSHADAGN